MFSFLNKKKDIEVKAPVEGTVVSLEKVNDPVFSQKMMGDGIAIQYTGGDVYAPMSGVISAVILPSMHAFGIRHEDGAELLIHIGLETVNLKGEAFTLLKQQGDRVQVGDKILEVDYALLKQKGIDLITPMILTNMNEFSLTLQASEGNHLKIDTETVFTVKKKGS